MTTSFRRWRTRMIEFDREVWCNLSIHHTVVRIIFCVHPLKHRLRCETLSSFSYVIDIIVVILKFLLCLVAVTSWAAKDRSLPFPSCFMSNLEGRNTRKCLYLNNRRFEKTGRKGVLVYFCFGWWSSSGSLNSLLF